MKTRNKTLVDVIVVVITLSVLVWTLLRMLKVENEVNIGRYFQFQ